MSKKEMTNNIQKYLVAKKYQHQFCSSLWHDYFMFDTGVLKAVLLFGFLFKFDSNKYIINTTTRIERFKLKFSHVIKII